MWIADGYKKNKNDANRLLMATFSIGFLFGAASVLFPLSLPFLPSLPLALSSFIASTLAGGSVLVVMAFVGFLAKQSLVVKHHLHTFFANNKKIEVLDLPNESHHYLARHLQKRLSRYTKEGDWDELVSNEPVDVSSGLKKSELDLKSPEMPDEARTPFSM
jgi:hypothetical protein